MRALTGLFTGVLLLPGLAFGQAPPTAPAFEISDIHTSPRTTNLAMRGNVVRDGRYEIRNATMVDLIRTAYGVEADKVVGGPSWLELDRFEVIGKVPAGTNVAAAREMLKTLLADRFKLVSHPATQNLSAFVLTAPGGKHKMKEASGPGPGCQPVPQQPAPDTVPMQVAQCQGITMAAFAQLLPQAAGAYVTSPVTESTGLTGAYDFELRWHGRGLLGKAGADATTIFDALDKQLGLKLELKEALPSSVIVVDSVNRTPAPNSPEVAKALPPPPAPEFEVAELKPSDPASTAPPQGRIQPNGRVDAVNIPLRDLIALAWDVTPEMLVNTPSWAESAKYDIIARATTTDAGPGTPPIDQNTLQAMLRALLIDRFQMKTHMEERPVTAYTLMAANPKLTPAKDPNTRTKCIEGPGPNARDPRNNNPILSRLVNCTNMTVSEFAQRLQGLAAGYIRVPVLDKTGIEGSYNFVINFSPIGAIQPAANADASTGAASLPTGAVSLLDALPQQLGLRLVQEKRPNPVLVIDSAVQLKAN